MIRLTIENAIHRKAFEIAQHANSEQEGLLRQLLAVTFQAAKEGYSSDHLRIKFLFFILVFGAF